MTSKRRQQEPKDTRKTYLMPPVRCPEERIANVEFSAESICVLRTKVKCTFSDTYTQTLSERICHQQKHVKGKHSRVFFREKKNDTI